MTENSHQNIIIFFILKTSKVLRKASPPLNASQGVTISSTLLWLLTGRHFGENQHWRTLHLLVRQVSSQITFSPPSVTQESWAAYVARCSAARFSNIPPLCSSSHKNTALLCLRKCHKCSTS